VERRRIYFFDGSAGCDLCAASTGYTFGERPKRPHPFCDCPVEELVELRDDVAEEDIPEVLVEHTELGDDGYEDPSVTAGATIPIVPKPGLPLSSATSRRSSPAFSTVPATR
jgi:hypothetical protein